MRGTNTFYLVFLATSSLGTLSHWYRASVLCLIDLTNRYDRDTKDIFFFDEINTLSYKILTSMDNNQWTITKLIMLHFESKGYLRCNRRHCIYNIFLSCTTMIFETFYPITFLVLPCRKRVYRHSHINTNL